MRTILFGASDDLIEIEGAISEECYPPNSDEKTSFHASDGTTGCIYYYGKWNIEIANKGLLFDRIVHGIEDSDGCHKDAQIHEIHNDVPSYSDVLIFKPGLTMLTVGKIRLVREPEPIDTNYGNNDAMPSALTKPLPEDKFPAALDAIANMQHLTDLMGFIETVKDMRDAQKSFFKTREQSFLSESKRLEKVVDGLLVKFDERNKAQQTKLF